MPRDRLPASSRRKRGELWAAVYLRLFDADASDAGGAGDDAPPSGPRGGANRPPGNDERRDR
ncbi:hypothetical protein [Halostella litorea]|uniref:hypothetical protein n=1 Tax=Halostella litorea TaxID=2528831 RepID=UPI00109292F7|nr:hypothetical protein [Halostella litorea]